MNSYKSNAADQAEIIKHFKGCDFDPPLESYVDVQAYTKKILEKAERFEAWQNNELAGLVAVYCNDFESRQCFITMVSVMSKYARQGIAKELLTQAIDHCKNQNFITMKLEVKIGNEGAIKLYENFGFVIADSTDEAHIMSLDLRK